MSKSIKRYLDKAEIHELTRASDVKGWSAVASTWGLIAFALVIPAWSPNVFTILLSLFLLGGRHLALAILMHEASHRSLFRTRWLNDVIGKWLCAAPAWQHLDEYRVHHLGHHSRAGSDNDPDASLVHGFPTTRASLKRKFTRDLLGVTGLKRIYGLLSMDLGFIAYTAANDVRRLPQKERSKMDILRFALRRLSPLVVVNFILFSILWNLDIAWVYSLWLLSWMTTYSLFLRIRSIAEHAGTDASDDVLRHTRTTLANIVARLSVAPHRVNLHTEHHLLMTVPYFNLPKMHALLVKRGAFDEGHLAKGYFEVLRSVSSE